MLHQEEEEEGLLVFLVSSTLCFGGWSRLPAAAVGLLRRPPERFTHPYPAGRQQPEGSLPPQKPQAWEVGGGVGKPKIQPGSNSHPPL